jgi:UDP-N-acetylmuramoylalanine--D-glutamate ligase
MTLPGPTLVLGLGLSGRAACRLLVRLGVEVVGYDRNPDQGHDLEGLAGRLSGPDLPDFDGFARIVQSPGVEVPPDPRVVPEIELAAEHIEAPILGITGTNGKSTTTALVGEMLRESGFKPATGGNLGTPLSELVGAPADRIVAELSSFQLEHAHRFDTAVAVLLNLAPDHLDRHGSVEAYGAAKARLAELQGSDGVTVYNADDPWASEVAGRCSGRTIPFSVQRALPEGASLDGDALRILLDGETVLSVALDRLSEAARLPVDNAVASAAAARAAGATHEGIARALERFRGLPHRVRPVCTRGGVRYVDDSKATNPSAAARSLGAQSGRIVWIAGGRNKGLDFAPLRDAVSEVRVAVLCGEAALDLQHVLEGTCQIVLTRTLEEAVNAAAEYARPDDTVLLAPACASHDEFASFEERGKRFEELTLALGDGTT